MSEERAGPDRHQKRGSAAPLVALVALAFVAGAVALFTRTTPRSPAAAPESSLSTSSSLQTVATPGSSPPAPDDSAVWSPAPTPSLAQAQAKALVAQANRCWWDDINCSLEEAERLYVAADDNGAEEIDCFVFYYGRGVRKDWHRARLCLERQVHCGGVRRNDAYLLPPLYLAGMMLVGQGGPRDAKRAETILEGCLNGDLVAPGDRAALASEAKAHGDPASTEPLDVCKHVSGSSLFIHHCFGIDSAQQRFDTRKALKAFVGTADPQTAALVKTAQKAFDDYQTRVSLYAGDGARLAHVHSRLAIQVAAESSVEKERQELFEYLSAFVSSRDTDVSAAEIDLEAAYKQRQKEASDKQHAGLLKDAQEAWRTYRAAEVALCARVLGTRYDPARVAREVTRWLTKKRTLALRPE